MRSRVLTSLTKPFFFRLAMWGFEIVIICGSSCFPGRRNREFSFVAVYTTLHLPEVITVPEFYCVKFATNREQKKPQSCTLISPFLLFRSQFWWRHGIWPTTPWCSQSDCSYTAHHALSFQPCPSWTAFSCSSFSASSLLPTADQYFSIWILFKMRNRLP